MPIILGDLRAALLNAGADEAHAEKAAAEVATYEARLANTDSRLAVLTWMVGANIAISTAILFRIFH